MQTHEVKHFNWLNQLWGRKWCCQRVGLRYFDAPLPKEMHWYSQFTGTWLTVNARRCFSVCFTPTGGHDPPPCHTYIYIDKNTDQSLTLLTTISCHLSAIQWITKMPINMFRQSLCLIRGALLVIFLNGYVTGMTEMTKEMESRTWEELAEVYRSVVILVICVIGRGRVFTTVNGYSYNCQKG